MHRGFLFLMVSILLSACSAFSQQDAQGQFETDAGVKIDPQLKIVTNLQQYGLEQDIVFQVINTKNVPVYFDDYSFGLRVYVYDAQSKQWRLVNRGFAGDRETVTVSPGLPKGPENLFLVSVRMLQASGKIRLLVVGWLDSQNLEGSKIAAFTDIEVVR